MSNLFVLPDNLAPYQVSRLNAVASAGVGVEVLTVHTNQHHRPWKDSLDVKFQIHSAPVGKEIEYVNDVLSSRRFKSVTFSGYGQPFRSLFMSCARHTDIKKGMFLDSFNSKRASMIKEYYKKWLLPRHLEFYIVPGQRQASYIRSVVRSAEVVISPYIPYERPILNENEQGQREFFLCISRLSPEKNLSTLLQAYRLYRVAGGVKGLIFVGDGPSRTDIVAEVEALSLGDHVTLTGWLAQDQIQGLFRSAFALVLPSTYEPFGVVVSEALQYGLPVIVSNKCGATDSVALHFRNGLVFDPSSVQDLTQCLECVDFKSDLYASLKEGAYAFSLSNDVHVAVAPLVNFYGPQK